MRIALALAFCSSLAAQQFRAARQLSMPTTAAPGVGCIAVGDVDGDGDLDLVFGNDDAPNQLYRNDGRGTFVDATAGRLPALPFPYNAARGVDLADIDGDGDLDLLVCSDASVPPRVYANDGTGVFTEVTATALPPYTGAWSYAQVVADFDGDGDVDWYIADLGAGLMYRNNGAGVFTDVTAAAFAPGFTLVTPPRQALDCDGDGDLDILLADGIYPGAPVDILWNQGNGTFVPAGAAAFPTPRPRSPAFAADVDGDGRPDLITDSGTRLLRNLGTAFLDVSAATLPRPLVQLQLAVDVDLDGDLDLVGLNALLRNDGNGVFTAVPGPGPGALRWLIAAADLDGDGDQDLVDIFGNGLANFARQIDAAAPPTRGQNYTVTLHDLGATALAIPAVALGDANVPLGALGNWRLDPTSMLLLGLHIFGPGARSLSIAIPPLPHLVGVTLASQALLAEFARPAHFTNAIADRIR